MRSWDDIKLLERRNLQSAQDEDGGYRRRDSGSLVWFANMTDRFHERMKLLEALEIRIVPSDADYGMPVKFDWDVHGYDNNYIWL